MKLVELFTTNVSAQKSSGEYSNKVRKADAEKVVKRGSDQTTSGSFGRIHRDTDNPHIVHKFNHELSYIESDGYLMYIKAVADKKIAQENPFAPRVYAVKEISDRNEIGRFKVQIETLINSKDLDVAELKIVVHSLFNNEDIHGFNKKLKEYSDPAYRMRILISRLLYACCEGVIETKSKHLKSVLNIVKLIQRRSSWLAPDFNTGNFMFRRGRSIPQLVITDPLAGSKYEN